MRPQMPTGDADCSPPAQPSVMSIHSVPRESSKADSGPKEAASQEVSNFARNCLDVLMGEI